MDNAGEIVIRTKIKPGDTGYITFLHGKLYAKEYGFDHTFEPYVAIPLSEFVIRQGPRERIWIVEKDGLIMGSVALVKCSEEQAQLRWLLLHPEIRERGIGRQLIGKVLGFARQCGYSSIFLLTLDILPRAASLYKSFGFKITEETKTRMWGREMVEQKYELTL
ncbi:MAG: GNAT family N-acetyltransferase [Bacillota bacterium]